MLTCRSPQGAHRGNQPGPRVSGSGRGPRLHPVGRPQAIVRLEEENGHDVGGARSQRSPSDCCLAPPWSSTPRLSFAQIEAAETELAAVLASAPGALRMASFPSAGATLMPLAIATFRERHRRDADARRGRARISPRGFAPASSTWRCCSASRCPERPTARRAHGQPVDDPTMSALPAAHPLAAKAELTLVDLRDEDLGPRRRPRAPRRARGQVLPRGRVQPNVTFESDDVRDRRKASWPRAWGWR